MSDSPVNLRAFRKAKARTEAERAAEANRVKFGRTKAEKAAARAEAERAAKAHAAGRIDPAARNEGTDS